MGVTGAATVRTNIPASYYGTPVTIISMFIYEDDWCALFTHKDNYTNTVKMQVIQLRYLSYREDK